MKTYHFVVAVTVADDVSGMQAKRIVRDAVQCDQDYHFGERSKVTVARLWPQPDGIYSAFPSNRRY